MSLRRLGGPLGDGSPRRHCQHEALQTHLAPAAPTGADLTGSTRLSPNKATLPPQRPCESFAHLDTPHLSICPNCGRRKPADKPMAASWRTAHRQGCVPKPLAPAPPPPPAVPSQGPRWLPPAMKMPAGTLSTSPSWPWKMDESAYVTNPGEEGGAVLSPVMTPSSDPSVTSLLGTCHSKKAPPTPALTELSLRKKRTWRASNSIPLGLLGHASSMPQTSTGRGQGAPGDRLLQGTGRPSPAQRVSQYSSAPAPPACAPGLGLLCATGPGPVAALGQTCTRRGTGHMSSRLFSRPPGQAAPPLLGQTGML